MFMSALYRSHALLGRESSAELDMIEEIRSANRQNHVTGYLHREADVYYQWIEGPIQSIETLLGNLQSDPRHTSFTLIGKSKSSVRRFPNWLMGYSTSGEGALLEWATRNNLSLRILDPAMIVSFFQNQAA